MCATDFLKTSAEYSLEFDDDLLTVPITDRWNFPMKPREMIGLSKDGNLRMTMAHWGLVPRWANTLTFGRRCYNARDDSLAQGKPAFREAFKERRCLLLGTGFIEYADRLPDKRATEFAFEDGRLIAYAGLYEVWGAQNYVSCTMITTEPNDLISPYHSRMPVILEPKNYSKWISPNTERAELLTLLTPFPSEGMLVDAAEFPSKH